MNLLFVHRRIVSKKRKKIGKGEKSEAYSSDYVKHANWSQCLFIKIKTLMEEDSWKADVYVINEVKEKKSAYSEYFNYNKPEPDRLTWPTTA